MDNVENTQKRLNDCVDMGEKVKAVIFCFNWGKGGPKKKGKGDCITPYSSIVTFYNLWGEGV